MRRAEGRKQVNIHILTWQNTDAFGKTAIGPLTAAFLSLWGKGGSFSLQGPPCPWRGGRVWGIIVGNGPKRGSFGKAGPCHLKHRISIWKLQDILNN